MKVRKQQRSKRRYFSNFPIDRNMNGRDTVTQALQMATNKIEENRRLDSAMWSSWSVRARLSARMRWLWRSCSSMAKAFSSSATAGRTRANPNRNATRKKKKEYSFTSRQVPR